MRQAKTRQSKARQGKVIQDKTRQGEARKDKENETGLGEVKQGKKSKKGGESRENSLERKNEKIREYLHTIREKYTCI